MRQVQCAMPTSDDGFDLPSPTDLVLGGLSNGPLEDSLFDLSDDINWALDEPWEPKDKTNTTDKKKSIHTMQQTVNTDPHATKSKRPLLSPDIVEACSKQTKTLESNQVASLSQDGHVYPVTMKTTPAMTGPTKDWDDIDPSLLDEFKDIVNFF